MSVPLHNHALLPLSELRQPGKAQDTRDKAARARRRRKAVLSEGQARRGPAAILMPVGGAEPSPPLLWRDRLQAERHNYAYR